MRVWPRQAERSAHETVSSAMRPSFLTADWRHLVFLNFDVDPALLRRHVPAGIELDLLRGRALVSVVAFRFLNTRVLGIPVPWHRNFDEVNLRAYVRRRVGGEWRRGVVFIRELVPRRAIAWTARAAYNEPYRAVRMRHRIAVDERTGGSVEYSWRQAGAWHSVSADVCGAAAPIDPADDVGFITEHYFGYTAQRNGSTVEYRVAHQRWGFRRACRASLRCDIRAVYGPEWVEALSAEPGSAFVCDGAPVSISFPVTMPT
jgi:uncharacterized protein